LILADENIDRKIINAIRNLNIEVYSIFENNRGLSDYQIIQFSKDPPRIILTEDKDFGEWVFAHNQKEISVIFLRYDFRETAQIIDIISRLLTSKEFNLIGKFTIISAQKIRIREI
jgi:predicted nuclease of predicted toxin-antitoxin system